MKAIFKLLLRVLALLLIAFAASWLIFMPDSSERGAWRSETGGAVLHLTPLKATLYSETAHSCLSVIAFPAHMKLVELLEQARVEVKGDRLELIVDGSLNNAMFDRIDVLPAACDDPDVSTATPRDVFDAAWTAMDENYAFFDLHGVNWAERKALAPAPNAQMDDAEINAMLLDMTAGIDDGHVHFGSDTIGYDSPSERPSWLPEGSSLSRKILNDIAIANSGATLTTLTNAPMSYGLRRDGIGYVLVRGMDVDVPIGGNSTDAMAETFKTVLDDLSEAKALIIDVRYNPGGSDTVSFGLASHFIDKALPVFNKTTRVGNGQTEPFTAVLEPYDATADNRPVVLMTSKLTGSAAEILTLAMREMPNVTVLGESTGGGLSDVQGFTLPNGWGLGLSNQTYLTMDGELFEAIGIPPDINVTYETPQFLAGRDPVLEAAIQTAMELMD